MLKMALLQTSYKRVPSLLDKEYLDDHNNVPNEV